MRIVLVLLAVVLFAGHVGGASIQIADTETASYLVDDDVVVSTVEPSTAQAEQEIRAIGTDVSSVPAVARTRVFRPPRHAFA